MAVECLEDPMILNESSHRIRVSLSNKAEDLGKYKPVESKVVEFRCCHCQQKKQDISQWTPLKIMRVLGQCVLLLVLASCVGVFLSSSLDGDHDIPPGYSEKDHYLEHDNLLNVQFQPVMYSDFKKYIRVASNPYDLVRIFLRKKDLSNDDIHELLSVKTIENLLSGKEKHKRGDDYDESLYTYDEEMATAATDLMEEKLAEAYYHIEEMETSRLGQCKYPQPEIVYVEEEPDLNRFFFPECTILHRCRNTSGCCGNRSQECGPKYVQVVTKTFLVISLSQSENATVLPHKEMIATKTFINHTECGCRDRKKLPGCNQICPFPFHKFRPNLKCICDCFEADNEENHKCKRIKAGVSPLSEKDLECIKSGKCMAPECTNKDKDFDVRTGYCPRLSVDELALRGFLSPSHKRKKHRRHNKKRKHRGK